MDNRKAVKTILLSLILLFLVQVSLAASASGSDFSGALFFDKEVSLSEQEQAWLAEDHVVRIRMGHWSPFMEVDSDRQGSGISAQYITGIFDKYHIRYQWLSDEFTFPETLEEIRKKGAVDMVPAAAYTEERGAYMLFTDIYISSPWVIFTRTDSDFISALEDLQGKTVAIPDGYVIKGLIEKDYPDIKLHVVTGITMPEDSLKLLSTGRVDAYVGNLTASSYAINKHGYNNIKVAAPTEYGNHDNAMAIRNDWPELVSIVNKELATVDVGQKNDLYSQWMSVRYEHGIRVADILTWGLIALGVVGAGFFLVYRLNRRLHELSRTDQMTKLFNHETILKILESKILESRRYQEPLIILLLDIDDFKYINDQWGHREGDTVITTIADSLKQAAGDSNHVGRYGGDEFLIILPRTSLEAAIAKYEEFRTILLNLSRDSAYWITTSCGIAEYTGCELDELIGLADERLYQAKRNGKNCYVSSSEAL